MRCTLNTRTERPAGRATLVCLWELSLMATSLTLPSPPPNTSNGTFCCSPRLGQGGHKESLSGYYGMMGEGLIHRPTAPRSLACKHFIVHCVLLCGQRRPRQGSHQHLGQGLAEDPHKQVLLTAAHQTAPRHKLDERPSDKLYPPQEKP